jgi:hypothetical protein
MKNIYAICITLCLAMPAFADQEVQVVVQFNDKTMCLHEGKVHTIGSRIIVNEIALECINARPDSYFVDKAYPAKWIPVDRL